MTTKFFRLCALSWAITATILALTPVGAAAGEKLRVVTAIPPFTEFVRRIGGVHVVVESLIGEAQSPHTFEPSPRQIAALADADLYIGAQLPFEKAMMQRIRSAAPNLSLIDGVAGARRADAKDQWHLWLDVTQARAIAANIATALANADPEHGDVYRAGLEAYGSELKELDTWIRGQLTPYRGRSFFVVHPALESYAFAYGLREMALEHEGKEPGPRFMAEIIEQARAEHTRVVYAIPQVSAKPAEVLAKEIGASVATINPMAASYLDNMRAITRAIVKGFAQP